MWLQFDPSAMDRILGLHYDVPSSLLYGVGRWKNGTCLVYVSSAPGSFRTVAVLDELGNGLDMHTLTGYLYTSAEGSITPWSHKGAIYQVNPETGSVLTIGTTFQSRSKPGFFFQLQSNSESLFSPLFFKQLTGFGSIRSAISSMWVSCFKQTFSFLILRHSRPE